MKVVDTISITDIIRQVRAIEGYVDMGYYDDEGFDPGDYIEFPHTRPVARKEYKCKRCGDPINVGEKHLKVCGVYEGKFFTDRMHHRNCFLEKEYEQEIKWAEWEKEI